MIEITPAIISESFALIEQRVKFLENLTPWVHLDVMDGKFVPPTTWNKADDLDFLEGKIKTEVHLMVERPEEVLPEWREVADRVVVHLEATKMLPDIIDAFAPLKVELGVALKLETSLEEILPYAEKVDLIQLMSIAEIGYHGHGFDEKVLERIKTLREQFPDVKIQIDGGVNDKTGREAILAGADVLVAGSFIWQSADPGQTILQLQNLV